MYSASCLKPPGDKNTLIRQLTVNEREAHSAAGMAADTAWPQLTSQLPCSCRGDSGIIYLFLGSRHNSHPKHYLFLAIKLNLCYNKSAQQKGITKQTVTVRTQGSSGTPVISVAEFTFTQGCLQRTLNLLSDMRLHHYLKTTTTTKSLSI